MSNVYLPPDAARAALYKSAPAKPLKYLRSDGSVTSPGKRGVEVLPPDAARAVLYKNAAAEPLRFLYPDGSVHDAELESGGTGGGQTDFETALQNEAAARDRQITEAINTEAENRLRTDQELNAQIIETNRVLSGHVTQTLASDIILDTNIGGQTYVPKARLAASIPLISGGSLANDAAGTLAVYAGDSDPDTAVFRTKTTSPQAARMEVQPGDAITLTSETLQGYAWVKIVGYHEMNSQAYGMQYTPAPQSFRVSEWTIQLNADPDDPKWGLFYSGGFDTSGAVYMGDADAVFHNVVIEAAGLGAWGLGNSPRPVLIYLYK